MVQRPQVSEVEVVFQTNWFVLKAKRGTGFDEPYYVFDTSDYVTVVPVTAKSEIVFVRQFRPSLEAYTLELPSGHIDGTESPEAAAKRELLEETGYEATSITALGSAHPDTGRLSNRLWMFFAEVRLVGSPEAGVETVLKPVAGLREMIEQSELSHALDLSLLMKASLAGLVKL